MNPEDGLAFLAAHQPLPPDSELTNTVIDQYGDVLKHFRRHPDARCIPLLLNSFGAGSGLGVYQIVEDTVRAHEVRDVLPHLVTALANPAGSVQYWAAQIAEYYPSTQLVAPLSALLSHRSSDVRSAAAAALEGIDDPRVRVVLQDALQRESEPDIIEQLRSALD